MSNKNITIIELILPFIDRASNIIKILKLSKLVRARLLLYKRNVRFLSLDGYYWILQWLNVDHLHISAIDLYQEQFTNIIIKNKYELKMLTVNRSNICSQHAEDFQQVKKIVEHIPPQSIKIRYIYLFNKQSTNEIHYISNKVLNLDGNFDIIEHHVNILIKGKINDAIIREISSFSIIDHIVIKDVPFETIYKMNPKANLLSIYVDSPNQFDSPNQSYLTSVKNIRLISNKTQVIYIK